MTCIVGIVDGGKVIIGADSAACSGLDRRTRVDRKAFVNGELIFGGTTSFRMLQLLQFALTPPPIIEGRDPYSYAVRDLVPAIRQCMKDGGWSKAENGREEGGTFLVGFRGHLFSVHSDYQVAEEVDGIASCGCGESYAMGAMHALKGKPAQERLQAGLDAAVHFSAGVAPPFHFVELQAKA